VRDGWFRRANKPQTYAQAWLSAAILAVLIGACFSVFALISNWQSPWLQFAVALPAWFLVIAGLRSSYDIRRRRASTRRG
jgi:peptidoglycan/LPS O-acetylase OafA/YrhL